MWLTPNVSSEITLAGLAEYFKDDTNCISKGELKYNDNYVLEVSLVDMNIFAVVRALMGDRSYNVNPISHGL